MRLLAVLNFAKMPKSREQKKEIVEKLADKLKRAKIVVFSSFSQRGKKGLDVTAMMNLKNALKQINSEYAAAKKTLLQLALNQASLGEKIEVKDFEGSVGVLFGFDDLIEPAKILYKLSKENKALVIYKGVMDKNILSEVQIKELAILPPKDVLLGQAVGMVRYPLSGLVNVLQANIRNLVLALANIKR